MMEEKSFYTKYVNEPIPWVTFDKGPWLKPAVAKTATTLLLQITEEKKLKPI